MLLGRDSELGQVEALVARVSSERGAVAVLEGPAGIGKTALLAHAAGRAAGVGFSVLWAAGMRLERDYPYGVVRQLFRPVIARAGSEDLLDGAAGLARPSLGLSAAGTGSAGGWGDAASGAMHGLYWLTANLADRAPLLIAVDDAHWADAMSLRFVLYLAHRIRDVPALLLIATRGAVEGDDELFGQLSGIPELPVLRPAPLTEPEVARLIGGDGDAGFVAECHRVCGGNPFLLGELLSALSDEGVRGSSGDAARVSSIAPRSIVQWVLARLVALGADAQQLATAFAVLGADAGLTDAASLAGLQPGAAAGAADSLIAANILSDERPYDFVHPLVRAAVYDGVSPARRAADHRRAAQLAADHQAPAAMVAAHLLACEPARDAWVVEALRSAAGEASASGAPASAARYLERALEEEPLRAVRAEVLVELGEAQLGAGLAPAAERLGEALELLDEPRRRAEVSFSLGRGLFSMGDAPAAAEALRRGLAELPETGDDLSLRLRAWYVIAAPEDVEAHRAATEWLQAFLQDTTAGRTRTERLLLAQHAYQSALSGRPDCNEVARLARRALSNGALLRDGGADLASYLGTCYSLIIAGELRAAIAELDRAIDLSRRWGSAVGFGWFSAARGAAHLRQGKLLEAIADFNAARAVYLDEYALGLRGVPGLLAICLIERGELAEAAEVLASVADLEQWIAQPAYIAYLCAVGRLKAAQGNTTEALDALLECKHRVEAMSAPNPALAPPWRSDAALLASQLGRADLARDLVADGLRLARAFGAPHAIAPTLRAAGLIEGGESGLKQLEGAVAVLDGSGCDLELACSLVEQGAALRRMGRRRDALDPLRRGLDLASRCGARVTADRAREEMLAAGARPRRERVYGVDALTASERRVARMAAEGMTNPEIAQALFVTVRTVTTHLGHVYQKLNITGRDQLVQALSAEAATPLRVS